MAVPDETTISWHPDRYVEVIFVGVQKPEQVREVDRQSRMYMEEHGPICVFIDARHGRIGRDAASFSVLMKLGRIPQLKRLIVLVDPNSTNPDAGRESGVIISMLTAALGKRPIYLYDEAQARQLAASE